MKFSKKIVFALISIFVLASISGCTTSLTQDKLDKINDRLELIDDFKEQIVLVEPTDSTQKYKSDTFRGIPFGTYRSDVLTLETLPLLNEYTNAVDFASTLMFNYSMTPTYWFKHLRSVLQWQLSHALERAF